MRNFQGYILFGLIFHDGFGTVIISLDIASVIGRQKVFTRPVNETVGTSCARFVSPLIRDRHFRPLARVPFHREVPFMDTPPAAGNDHRAAFFVGCLIDKIFPSVARAAVKVLRHHGVGIFLPAGQGCCGIPALSAGDTETFDRLLRRNLERFGF